MAIDYFLMKKMTGPIIVYFINKFSLWIIMKHALANKG